jgi:hypothetical protein
VAEVLPGLLGDSQNLSQIQSGAMVFAFGSQFFLSPATCQALKIARVRVGPSEFIPEIRRANHVITKFSYEHMFSEPYEKFGFTTLLTLIPFA